MICVCIHFSQVGKGLSKDEKAQKLALQHWLEAVSILFLGSTERWLYGNLIHNQAPCRLIPGIAMGTTCICIMMSGLEVKAHNHFSTGKHRNNTSLSVRNAHLFLPLVECEGWTSETEEK